MSGPLDASAGWSLAGAFRLDVHVTHKRERDPFAAQTFVQDKLQHRALSLEHAWPISPEQHRLDPVDVSARHRRYLRE